MLTHGYWVKYIGRSVNGEQPSAAIDTDSEWLQLIQSK